MKLQRSRLQSNRLQRLYGCIFIVITSWSPGRSPISSMFSWRNAVQSVYPGILDVTPSLQVGANVADGFTVEEKLGGKAVGFRLRLQITVVLNANKRAGTGC